ncbi:MAG: D-xylose transporter XylE [Bacteroidetes bacterium]|nr:MAG: D-xylose transporter XylE [Bacteroidota bacterium]
MINQNSKLYLLWISFIVALGGFLFGYDTGVIGGTQLYFTEYFNLSPAEQGFAVSSALYGALFGAILAGYLSMQFSRKYALIFSAFLFSISAWGSGMADSLTILVIYRIIGGLGVGIASMTSPMYIAEIAPAKNRGQLVSLYQLAVVFGFFIVFLATYFIGSEATTIGSGDILEKLHDYNVEKGWRVMFWSELIPALSFFLLLFTIPHTPRWLMLKSRDKDAEKVISRFIPDTEGIKRELNEIKLSLTDNKNKKLISVFAKGMAFVLFIGIMLSVFQQITGINAILYYGAEIFSNALGYGPEDALKQQLWLGTVNLIFTFVAIFTIDKWGRKPLLVVGTIGMFLGLSTLGLSIYMGQLGIVSLISILVFIGSFALSMGPVVWVLLSEIFPNSIRSIAMSIAVAAQWLFNAIVANSYPVINRSEFNAEVFNGALPYFIFAIMCIATLIFVWKYVPETKGKSLEEIEASWKSEA